MKEYKDILLSDIANNTDGITYEYGKMIARSVLKKVYDKTGSKHIFRHRCALENDIHRMDNMDFNHVPLSDSYDLINTAIVDTLTYAKRSTLVVNASVQSLFLECKPSKRIIPVGMENTQTYTGYSIRPYQSAYKEVRRQIDRQTNKRGNVSLYNYIQLSGDTADNTDTYIRSRKCDYNANTYTIDDILEKTVEHDNTVNTIIESLNLTARQADVLYLRYWHNASVRTISARHGVSERATQKTIEAIRKKAIAHGLVAPVKITTPISETSNQWRKAQKEAKAKAKAEKKLIEDRYNKAIATIDLEPIQAAPAPAPVCYWNDRIVFGYNDYFLNSEARAKAEAEAKARAKAEAEAKAKAKAEAEAKAMNNYISKEELDVLNKCKAHERIEAHKRAKARAKAEAKARAKAEAEARAKAEADRIRVWTTDYHAFEKRARLADKEVLFRKAYQVLKSGNMSDIGFDRFCRFADRYGFQF